MTGSYVTPELAHHQYCSDGDYVTPEQADHQYHGDGSYVTPEQAHHQYHGDGRYMCHTRTSTRPLQRRWKASPHCDKHTTMQRSEDEMLRHTTEQARCGPSVQRASNHTHMTGIFYLLHFIPSVTHMDLSLKYIRHLVTMETHRGSADITIKCNEKHIGRRRRRLMQPAAHSTPAGLQSTAKTPLYFHNQEIRLTN